jgi:hypothetical protein
MEKITFYGNKDKYKFITLLSENKERIAQMYEDAFGMNSPYQEDWSNTNDIIDALTSPIDK